MTYNMVSYPNYHGLSTIFRHTHRWNRGDDSLQPNLLCSAEPLPLIRVYNILEDRTKLVNHVLSSNSSFSFKQFLVWRCLVNPITRTGSDSRMQYLQARGLSFFLNPVDDQDLWLRLPKGWEQPGFFSWPLFTASQPFELCCCARVRQGITPQTNKIGNGSHLQFFADWANPEGPLWYVQALAFLSSARTSFFLRASSSSFSIISCQRGRPHMTWAGLIHQHPKDCSAINQRSQKSGPAFSRTVSLFAFKQLGFDHLGPPQHPERKWSLPSMFTYGETPNRSK